MMNGGQEWEYVPTINTGIEKEGKVNISAEWEVEIGETELGQFEDSK